MPPLPAGPPKDSGRPAHSQARSRSARAGCETPPGARPPRARARRCSAPFGAYPRRPGVPWFHVAMRGAGALEAFLRRVLPEPLPPPRRLPLWLLGGLVVLLTALLMVRRPDPPPLWDSFYTEDGKIFFSQALNGHFLNTLAASYFGYL